MSTGCSVTVVICSSSQQKLLEWWLPVFFPQNLFNPWAIPSGSHSARPRAPPPPTAFSQSSSIFPYSNVLFSQMFSVPKLFLSQNSSSHSRLSSILILSEMSLSMCHFPAQLLSSSFHSATVHHNPSSSSSETQDFYLVDCQKPQSPGSDHFCIVVLFLWLQIKITRWPMLPCCGHYLPTACLDMGCSSTNKSPERSKELAPICDSSRYCISERKKCLSNTQTVKKYIW